MAHPEILGPVDESSESSSLAIANMDTLTRSEINQQIETALAHPRSVTKFRKELKELSTMDPKIAEECFYTLKRKEKGGGQKLIIGPSVRFAEMLVYSWGNSRAGARVVSSEGEFVTAQGVFMDLERNNATTFEQQRRITNSDGKRYGADMIQTTGNAACSIAYRNAVTRSVPKALWNDIFEESKQAAVGKSQSIMERRNAAMQYGQKIGVSQDQIFNVLGISGIEDMGLDELIALKGLFNAVKDGEVTLEEAFGNPEDATISALAEKLGWNAAKVNMQKGKHKGHIADLLKYMEGEVAKLSESPTVKAEPAEKSAANGTGGTVEGVYPSEQLSKVFAHENTTEDKKTTKFDF